MTTAERLYYERRAPEYDDWYFGTGLFEHRIRPGWAEELGVLRGVVGALPFHSVLDIACGTGFLTASLGGTVVGLDQSASMLGIARGRVPSGTFVQGDALRLPFLTQKFDCLMAGHFYGHLDLAARALFLAEARRVSKFILVIDAAQREDVLPEEYQERVLNDGSRYVVYKRYFTPERLSAEIGAGRTLHAGRWFVALLANTS